MVHPSEQNPRHLDPPLAQGGFSAFLQPDLWQLQPLAWGFKPIFGIIEMVIWGIKHVKTNHNGNMMGI
jgi:hypothetical protein